MLVCQGPIGQSIAGMQMSFAHPIHTAIDEAMLTLLCEPFQTL